MEKSRLGRVDLEPFKGFDAGTVANAIDRLGLRPRTVGFTDTSIRCMLPDLPPVVGFAVTCREDTTSARSGDVVGFETVYEAAETVGAPTVIVCQDVGGGLSRSCHLGDIMSTIMHRIGVVAFATDGGVRDLSGIRSHAGGLQVFASGLVPGAGHACVIDVGAPVSIGGMEVRLGDVVFGDMDGMVAFPPERAGDVIEEARAIQRRESSLLEFIGTEHFTVAGYLEHRRKVLQG